jgi:hypothetical protein
MELGLARGFKVRGERGMLRRGGLKIDGDWREVIDAEGNSATTRSSSYDLKLR